MKNLWSDRDARAFVRRYRAQGANADVARRVYTTRLLGADPRLVLHGGGNTSWNAAHHSRGCSQAKLKSSGGAGLFYCFAVK